VGANCHPPLLVETKGGKQKINCANVEEICLNKGQNTSLQGACSNKWSEPLSGSNS